MKRSVGGGGGESGGDGRSGGKRENRRERRHLFSRQDLSLGIRLSDDGESSPLERMLSLFMSSLLISWALVPLLHFGMI